MLVACTSDSTPDAAVFPDGALSDAAADAGPLDVGADTPAIPPPDVGNDAGNDAGSPCESSTWDDGVAFSTPTWDDMDELACALRSMDVSAASVVCSGEDSHGVEESNILHAALARHLVLERGYRTIALELDRASVAPWNEYLRTGDESLIDVGFTDTARSLAETTSLESLVREMRNIALALPEGEELLFTGYDISISGHQSRAELFDFLSLVDPDNAADWRTRLDTRVTDDLAQAAGELASYIRGQQEEFALLSDDQAVDDALTDAANLRDGAVFVSYFNDGEFWVGNASYREPGMIRNMLNLVAARGDLGGILMVGHNTHCAPNLVIGTKLDGSPSPSVGTGLRLIELGEAYLMLGQLYAEGQERSPMGNVAVRGGTLEDELAAQTELGGLLFSSQYSGVDLLAERSGSSGTYTPATFASGWFWLQEVTPTQGR